MASHGSSAPPQQPKAPPKPQLNFLEDFVLSGAAAIISKTAAAPIERVKLLVQNQDEMIKTGRLRTPYKGIIDCFYRVLTEEGLIHFWRGNLANCVRYFPTQALNFAFKPVIRRLFGRVDPKDGYAKFLTFNIVSGGFAGVASLFFVYSLDFARTRLANDAKSAKQGSERQFKGMTDVYIKIWKSDGFIGLYRGFVISAVGIFIYRGFYFGLYDSSKVLIPKNLEKNFLLNFMIGWSVTTVAGLLSYPVDTIRRRMMMTSGEAVKYKSSIHAIGLIWKNEGILSFFKGAGANILRSIAGGGVLSGFDVFQDWSLSLKAQYMHK